MVTLIAPLLAAALPSLIGLAGSGISYLAGRRIDKKNREAHMEQNRIDREYNDNVMSRMRAEALADRDYNNWYNSPNQMKQRYKEAGLNLHNVFGGGAANGTAVMTRGTPTSNMNQAAYKAETGLAGNAINSGLGVMNSIWQGRTITAQTDNLKAQNQVLAQEAILKAAEVGKVVSETDLNKFDLGQKNALNDLVIEAHRLANSLTGTQIDLNTGQVAKTAKETDKLTEEIKQVIADVKNKDANTDLARQQIEESKAKAKVLIDGNHRDQERFLWDLAMKNVRNDAEMIELEKLRESWDQASMDTILKEIEVELAKQGINKDNPSYVVMYYYMWRRLMGLE